MAHDKQEILDNWTEEAKCVLKGRTIVNVAYAPPGDDEPGGDTYLMLVLDDGTHLWPMRDDEGNGPGAMGWANQTGSNGLLPIIH